ncbi:CotS family spore coat protein [Clostridium guangxiense]|uniref:CotS family spore coat protein n=1 Tax=Clostridium guangxiense TaxID=1662055 RepID=UPI001E49C4E3|nr:CotS family spore coat protein [Clostridium guangxiense]MCD2346680.1 CotS family spore coat protein [Clostridium guangxiense]
MLDLSAGRDRELLEYDLNAEMFEEFQLKVYNIVPVRKAYLLSTDKGDKVLKKVNYTIGEFNYIISAINYIKKNFDRIVDFAKTKDNKEYYIKNGELYCIMDMIDGRECEFSNPVDVSIASQGLSKLHKASEGFRTELPTKNNCGTFIESFMRKKDEMLFFKKISNLYEVKTEFDNIFIKNADYYINKIDESLERLKLSQYYKLCSEEDKIVLCHHDLAHHNIIINNEEAYFIDFDYSIVDLRVHDLCNFISKAVKNFDYDISKAVLILDNYCKETSLKKNELEVLYALLSFPNDFYTITRDYYSRRKDWGEKTFFNRLNNKISVEESRVEFLDEFKNNFL